MLGKGIDGTFPPGSPGSGGPRLTLEDGPLAKGPGRNRHILEGLPPGLDIREGDASTANDEHFFPDVPLFENDFILFVGPLLHAGCDLMHDVLGQLGKDGGFHDDFDNVLMILGGILGDDPAVGQLVEPPEDAASPGRCNTRRRALLVAEQGEVPEEALGFGPHLPPPDEEIDFSRFNDVKVISIIALLDDDLVGVHDFLFKGVEEGIHVLGLDAGEDEAVLDGLGDEVSVHL